MLSFLVICAVVAYVGLLTWAVASYVIEFRRDREEKQRQNLDESGRNKGQK